MQKAMLGHDWSNGQGLQSEQRVDLRQNLAACQSWASWFEKMNYQWKHRTSAQSGKKWAILDDTTFHRTDRKIWYICSRCSKQKYHTTPAYDTDIVYLNQFPQVMPKQRKQEAMWNKLAFHRQTVTWYNIQPITNGHNKKLELAAAKEFDICIWKVVGSLG